MYDAIDVLVVGAGPTGLTLGIELARRGVRARIVDASETPFAGSRGKGLQPRTLEVFDDLGIIDEILAAGSLYPPLRVHVGPFGIPWGSLGTSSPPSASTPYPNLWMVAQDRTQEILAARLEALGGRVEHGVALASFTQQRCAVTARLSSGETIRCAYLVGADGGRSTVRRSLGLELRGKSIDEPPSLVADVVVPGLDRSAWHVWPWWRGVVGLCPLPDGERAQLTAPARFDDALEASVRRVTGLAIERVLWRSIYRPQVRMVDRYRVGRVLLAGDAAHVHPPAGGQGLNTGVQDAYNLGWKLAAVLRREGGERERPLRAPTEAERAPTAPHELLESYERERLPVAASVLGLSEKLLRARSAKRGETERQLGIAYRESPLSSGASVGALHPGDRMPDACLSSGGRLHESMRGTHATEVTLDDGTRILVRPDGYVARIGTERTSSYCGVEVRSVALARRAISL